MNNRLTKKDGQGNWCVKDLPWRDLHVGQVITQETWERLYGCLWKLMEYEESGLDPERIKDLVDDVIYVNQQPMEEWISVAEQLPGCRCRRGIWERTLNE